MARFLAMSFSNWVISASASFKVVAMAVCSVLVGGMGNGYLFNSCISIPVCPPERWDNF
jgi:putative Ca2+/H+ antiporter (TMEM165/GDT1 family)